MEKPIVLLTMENVNNFSKYLLYKIKILVGTKFDSLNSKLKSLYTWDKCNSYNRYDCDLQNTLIDDIYDLRNSNEYAHLYYRAPSCVRDVLSSSHYIYNFLSLIFISMILI